MRDEKVEELRKVYSENPKTTVRGLMERFGNKRVAVVDALTAPRYGPNLLKQRAQEGRPDATAAPHHIRKLRINRCPVCRARKSRPAAKVPQRFLQAARARLWSALDEIASKSGPDLDDDVARALARSAWEAARADLRARIALDLYGGPKISASRGTGAAPPS